MSWDVFGAITAIATAATGIYVALQYHRTRAEMRPYIEMDVWKNGPPDIYVVSVYPAKVPIRYKSVRVRGAKIALAPERLDGYGQYVHHAPSTADLPEVPIDVLMPPSSVTQDPARLFLAVSVDDPCRSFEMYLYSSSRWRDVRYNVLAITKSKTD